MRVERLLQTADFERALGGPPRGRSAHFAVHHWAGAPGAPCRTAGSGELSTTQGTSGVQAVDDSSREVTPRARWLGVVVPKRHARRAVTRSLLKREIRAGVERHAAGLDAGVWIVRLRAPFDVQRFPSAASAALRHAARAEIDTLLDRLAATPARAAPA